MKLKKHILFISMFSAISGAQAASVGLLGGSLNDQTVFAHTYVTSGAGTDTVGNGWTVNGNVLADLDITIGASSSVTGSTQSRDLTTGDAAVISGNATTSAASTLGANATVSGNLQSGTIVSTGANATVSGNLQSGSAVTLGAGAAVAGTLDYGTAITNGAGASSGTQTQTSFAAPIIASESSNVSLAQSTLNAMTGGTTLTSGNIATGQTFTSGVYDVDGLLTTTADITLTLDAEGQDGDFIFNISNYLAFGAGTVIEVVNGTGNNNVVWNAHGAGGYVSTGARSDIIGTILATTYASVGANASVTGTNNGCGGVFSATSYVSLGANASVGGEGCVGAINTPSAVPLPAAVWLFGSGLLGLAGIARRKKA
jgi:cytoskeletal protein CcmA (bactofilin family)